MLGFMVWQEAVRFVLEDVRIGFFAVQVGPFRLL